MVEEAPRLGGRATAFTDRETGERVDNGQHVLFGCYRETYAFLEQVGAAHLAPLQSRLTLAMADTTGRMSRLECPDWRPPLHLAAGVLRWRAIPLRDRLSALRMGRVLLDARRRGAEAVANGVAEHETVDAWLRRHGQTPAICEWLWHPLAVAALNESPRDAAARPFVRVLGEMFGPRPQDSAVGLPAAPLDEIFAEPARRFIEARGGRVIAKASARVEIDPRGGISAVRAGTDVIETTRVVSTVPWHAIGRIWAGDPPGPLAAILRNAVAMRSSPIVSVNLWLENVELESFVGLIGGPMHWVFPKVRGSNGPKVVRSHLAMVSSGATDLVDLENAEITRIAVDQLQRSLPALASVNVVRSVVVREHRATFSVAPGSPPRPGPETPIPGFYLAGDWTDTGLPGTIEGAALSGHRAASLVLAR